MSSLQNYGLAIDFETTGFSLPNYAERHQGISFGAIIFDMRTFESIDAIYHEIKFKSNYSWAPKAEEIHGLSKEHLEEHGITQEEAALELLTLIHKYCGSDPIVLLGHRVNFDRAFIDQLVATQHMEVKYNPTVIDTSALSTVFLETPYSNDLFQMLGFEARGKHNALEDIMMTLESVRIFKEHFMNGIALTL